MDNPKANSDPANWDLEPGTQDDEARADEVRRLDPDEAARLQDPTGASRGSGAASSQTNETSGSGGQAVTNSDFGVHSGEPSGTGGNFSTSDPAMADEPAEGGEQEVDQ